MKKNFDYLNTNPLSLKESDCVTRAITYATGEDYTTIRRKLRAVATLYGCERLCVCCYHYLLENYYGYPRINGFKGFTINEFLNYNPKGIYIIRVEGHLTCVKNGRIKDIWDCGNELVDIIWKVM